MHTLYCEGACSNMKCTDQACLIYIRYSICNRHFIMLQLRRRTEVRKYLTHGAHIMRCPCGLTGSAFVLRTFPLRDSAFASESVLHAASFENIFFFAFFFLLFRLLTYLLWNWWGRVLSSPERLFLGASTCMDHSPFDRLCRPS